MSFENSAIIQFRFQGIESSHVLDKKEIFDIKTFMQDNEDREIAFDYLSDDYNIAFHELLSSTNYENFIDDALKPQSFVRLYDGKIHNSYPEIDLVELVKKEFDLYKQEEKKSTHVNTFRDDDPPNAQDVLEQVRQNSRSRGIANRMSREMSQSDSIENSKDLCPSDCETNYKKTFVLKKDSLNGIYLNKEHNLVFDMQSKKVTSKFINGEYFPLNNDDKKICDSYHVKYANDFESESAKPIEPLPDEEIEEFEEPHCETPSPVPPHHQEYIPDDLDNPSFSPDDYTPNDNEVIEIYCKLYSLDKGMEFQGLDIFTDEQISSLYYGVTGNLHSKIIRETMVEKIKNKFYFGTLSLNTNLTLECKEQRNYILKYPSQGITYEDLFESCRVFRTKGNRIKSINIIPTRYSPGKIAEIAFVE